MSDAERMITLLTAMLGELAEIRESSEAIRKELAETGKQLAFLIAGELFEVPQGRAN